MRPAPEMSGTPAGALLRAGIATLLLAVLLYFALAQEPAPEVVQAEPAAAEPPPSLLLPQGEPAPAAAEPALPPPVEMETPAVVPPPEPVPAAPAPEPAAAPEPAVPAPPPTVSEPAPPAASKPAPAPAPAPASAPVGKLQIVQLGDFVPLPAARNLLDAAITAGHTGRMLHRVLVGPFASRDAARKAVEAGAKGIVVNSGGSWWVQAGVFSDAENADRLRATLAMEGRQVVVHGRAEIGPFPSRSAAEKALAGMRAALGKPLPDAAIVAAR